jgi:pantoate--beta-alanine ligase
MSSRNRLLSPASVRRRGACRRRSTPAALVARGETRATAIVSAAAAVIAAEPQARVDYCEARDPETLDVVEAVTGPTLLALAVWVGSVRLIDNRVLVPGRTNR